jgi:hypothetical protein
MLGTRFWEASAQRWHAVQMALLNSQSVVLKRQAM